MCDSRRFGIPLRSVLFAAAGCAVSFAAPCALAADAAAPVRGLKVMSYNVQNLFDTVDDPQTQDEEFTPKGAQRWSPQLVADKMENLAEVIESAAPDVVGLVEVENEAIVQELAKTALAGRYPHVAVANSQDSRGIRPALLSRFPIINMTSHNVSDPDWNEHGQRKFGRDILEVTVDTNQAGDARYVTFLVNHWLSRAGGPERDTWRMQEARALREIMDGILRNHPERLVVAMGDFNDGVKDASIREGLGAKLDYAEFLKASGDAVYAVGGELSQSHPQRTGTYYYHQGHEWSDLDHLFVARSASARAAMSSQAPSFRVVTSRFTDRHGRPQGCELPRSSASRGGSPAPRRCPEGASDHLPIVTEI
jgi:predicted extracellular nuclease